MTNATASDRRASFERDGFLIIDDCFTPAEMAAAKNEITRVLPRLREGRDGPDNGVYVGLARHSAFFARLHADPRIVDALVDVVGENLEFWSDKVVYKSATVRFGSPWHQDWPYWKGANKYSVWIAIDEATPDNGCLRFLPRSHRALADHDGHDAEGIGFGNRLRPGAVDERQAVTCAVASGTAVVFHDLALHASFPNRSGADRWSVISTYRDVAQDDLEYDDIRGAFLVSGRRLGRPLGPGMAL
jgi:phytanoyl-CoA hydroxylase